MPRVGGIYQPTAGFPVTSGTVADSSDVNDLVADFGTEITGSIPRDGSASPTGPTPWGGQKITGLGDATAATDALNRQAADARYARLDTSPTFSGTSPSIVLNETDAPANEGRWAFRLLAGALRIDTFDDADVFGAGVAVFDRTGTTIDSIDFLPTSLKYNGIEIGFRAVPQNIQAGNYICVAADAGKHIYHASGAGAGDTYTIPANASVAYGIGTELTFINADSNSVTIAITSDTMTLAGTTSTGSRTLAQNGRARAIKLTNTTWLIDGVGLT